MKVLVVDDDQLILNLLVVALGDAGFEVMTAMDGQEAQDIFRQTSPEIVITDIVMPEIDGIELLIKLQKINPGIKIIAMSGGNSGYAESYLSIADKLGATAVINKPFDVNQLVKTVKELSVS